MTTQDTIVADTILEQLGGESYVALAEFTGIVKHDNAVEFDFSPGLCESFGCRYSHVKITLAGDDTYRLDFTGNTGEFATFTDVYEDRFQDLFEEVTNFPAAPPFETSSHYAFFINHRVER